LLDPSRQDIAEYVDYLKEIDATAAAVNARFGREGWLPVDLRVRDDFAETLAGYKQYDVLLVNAGFGGLNLVAKEAPLLNARDGRADRARRGGRAPLLHPGDPRARRVGAGDRAGGDPGARRRGDARPGGLGPRAARRAEAAPRRARARPPRQDGRDRGDGDRG